MPEILTKYPELALKILKDGKVACGEGKPQRVLTTCPKEQFCSLPTGEICVYGVHDINATTQFHPLDFALIGFSLPFLALITLVFTSGMIAGMFWKK